MNQIKRISRMYADSCYPIRRREALKQEMKGMTRDQLYTMAKRLGVEGVTTKTKKDDIKKAVLAHG